jgi:hypothetical protein
MCPALFQARAGVGKMRAASKARGISLGMVEAVGIGMAIEFYSEKILDRVKYYIVFKIEINLDNN